MRKKLEHFDFLHLENSLCGMYSTGHGVLQC